MQQFTDLTAWQKCRVLANSIYRLTKTFPKDEVFGLTSQMRRCAVSIPSNIAEGCGRGSRKESIQFYYFARGSLYELECQLYISFDQGYIDQTKLTNALSFIAECKKLLNGLIRRQKSLIPNVKALLFNL